jgi:5'-nucleotidase
VADVVLAWYASEGARPASERIDRADERGRTALLNVNVPDVAPAELRGLRAAPLAAQGAVTTTITERDRGSFTFEYHPVEGPAEPGSDAALVADGCATYTQLRPVCDTGDGAIAQLETEFAA